jgi:hypothetical protein
VRRRVHAERTEQTNKNDNTNTIAKAAEQKEIERIKKSEIHKNVARHRRQSPKRRGKESAIKRKREGDVQNNKHFTRDCPCQSKAR